MPLRLEVCGFLSNTTNIRRSYGTLTKEEQFDGYSRVVIVVDEDNKIEYSSGFDTGRTLTLNCPFGTQKMADDILVKIRGHQYQPFAATGAHIDPATEIGDGITVGGVYGGVFTKDITHGSMYTADVSAPGGEKINYAYPYKAIQRRKIERNFRDVSATFKVQADMISQEVEERKAQGEQFKAQFQVQADQISAKVSKTGGSSSSFGWELTDSSWTLKSDNSTVLKATKSGLEIKGLITATGGEIGGFDIQSNYLSYNGQTWGGTNTTGAYLGTSGLQLGKNFKVDMQGNLNANSGTFTGTVHAGNIDYGGDAGYFSGSGLSGGSVYGTKIAGSTLGTSKFTGGVNTSLGYADFSNGVFNGYNRARQIACDQISSGEILMGGRKFGTSTIAYKGTDDEAHTINVVTWAWR